VTKEDDGSGATEEEEGCSAGGAGAAAGAPCEAPPVRARPLSTPVLHQIQPVDRQGPIRFTLLKQRNLDSRVSTRINRDPGELPVLQSSVVTLMVNILVPFRIVVTEDSGELARQGGQGGTGRCELDDSGGRVMLRGRSRTRNRTGIVV
jgi:hypothetical protein